MVLEKIMFQGRPVRRFYLKEYGLASALVTTVLAMWLMGLSPFIIFVYGAVALAAFLVAAAEFSRLRHSYRITPSHVIIEEGIISKKRKSFSMANISEVSVNHNYLQRMLKYGTVVVGSSSGRDMMSLSLRVHRPRRIAVRLEGMIKDYDMGK